MISQHNGPGLGHEFGIPVTRDTLLADMQLVAPPGQQLLDPATTEHLRYLTATLLATEGNNAQAEYGRFLSAETRGLSLDHARLREQLGGKTILVTGGTGCVGSALLAELTQYGPARVASISRGVTNPWRLVLGADYLNVDIRDKHGLDFIFKAVRPDIVYHLAAQRDPSLAENTVAQTLTTNITGTRNVIEAARASGASQLVHNSTGKAMRPFSPDTYASSKKVSELLMAEAAQKGDILCSGARITHLVDNSIIHQRLLQWIAADGLLRLHSADALFYIQSAREAAHLLLNASLEPEAGTFNIQAVRELDWPISLVDLALGTMQRTGAVAPIYICGFESGYEEQPYPGLFDPQYSGNVSPLISALEASQAEASTTCSQIDRFPFRVVTDGDLADRLAALELASAQGRPDDELHQLKHGLSWAMLGAHLRATPAAVLERAVQRIETFSKRQPATLEHVLTNMAIGSALRERQP